MPCLFVSTGCPAGIGPEVSVAAVARLRSVGAVLVGDKATLLLAADQLGVARRRFKKYDESLTPKPGELYLHQIGPALAPDDRRPGHPSRRAGQAQLLYLAEAYRLTKHNVRAGAALVTGPVNKAAIAHSGGDGSARFRGHTEWLGEADAAASTVMCFFSKRLVTSLATTHMPLAKVSRHLTKEVVRDATLALTRLLHALGQDRPRVAVCALNPHAGEEALFGDEEARSIIPGMRAARRSLRGNVELVGPIGAETAYRKAALGEFHGVVAMYHDQATIPMKVLAFGEAVNVTMGLSIVRTSVDHGTAYDIAGKGIADPTGMVSALRLAARLASAGVPSRPRRSRRSA